MKAYIKQIAYYLPEISISNEKLIEEFPEWTVGKIASKVGVNNRHVAGEQETASDMAGGLWLPPIICLPLIRI
mgnify:CR=1 FL=1